MQFTAADYKAAERLLPNRLLGCLKNAGVNPHWIGESDRFWYRRESVSTDAYVLVNAVTGKREVIFDRAAVAVAIQTVTGCAVEAADLNVRSLDFDDANGRVYIHVDGAVVTYDRTARSCRAKAVRCIEADELPSPDGRCSAFSRANDLWLRARDSGEERRLTTDGEPHYGYGVLSDAGLVAIPLKEERLQLPPIGVVWSPDSRHLVVARVDERHVREYPYVRSVPLKGARPQLHLLRRAIVGDRAQPLIRLFIVDAQDGTTRAVAMPRESAGLEGGSDLIGDGTCWFDSSGLTFYYAQADDASKTLRLVAVDLASARARTLIEERAACFLNFNLAIYNTPNVRVLGDGREIVWFSERDGWGHLYLYDGRGVLKRQLTKGEWVVFDIIHVDEDRRSIYCTGSSREPDVNPYWRFLYRVSLDGGEPVLLTPEHADHMIDGLPVPMARILYKREAPGSVVSPSGRFFVSSHSTLSTAPVSVLRAATDGQVLAVLEHADTSEIDAVGYRPPEPFVAKAADGVTDLYGVIYWPPDRDPQKQYPIIDALYNGFQVSVVPANYVTGVVTPNPYGALCLAALGFIVVTLDARGTARRSRAFHDHSYQHFGDAGLDDHVAVIRQLAQRHHAFDLERVGVYGYSFGGYYSTRAILRYPDFFKVAVSGAACHNWQGMYPGYENLVGPPVFSDGAAISPDGDEIPVNYTGIDNAALASRLQGKLLLFIGDLDENVPPAVNFQFADALTRAGKEFDLAILWGETHFGAALLPTVIRKSWDFFIRHLMGAHPPDWNAG